MITRKLHKYTKSVAMLPFVTAILLSPSIARSATAETVVGICYVWADAEDIAKEARGFYFTPVIIKENTDYREIVAEWEKNARSRGLFSSTYDRYMNTPSNTVTPEIRHGVEVKPTCQIYSSRFPNDIERFKGYAESSYNTIFSNSLMPGKSTKIDNVPLKQVDIDFKPVGVKTTVAKAEPAAPAPTKPLPGLTVEDTGAKAQRQKIAAQEAADKRKAAAAAARDKAAAGTAKPKPKKDSCGRPAGSPHYNEGEGVKGSVCPI